MCGSRLCRSPLKTARCGRVPRLRRADAHRSRYIARREERRKRFSRRSSKEYGSRPSGRPDRRASTAWRGCFRTGSARLGLVTLVLTARRWSRPAAAGLPAPRHRSIRLSMPAWTMSSETSTEHARSDRSVPSPGSSSRWPGWSAPRSPSSCRAASRRPRVILLSLTVFAAAAVGIAALRTVMPLTPKSACRHHACSAGVPARRSSARRRWCCGRSRSSSSIARWGRCPRRTSREMSARLRARAAGLMRQLDAGAGYREQIEQEIEKRIGKSCRSKRTRRSASKTRPRRTAGSRTRPTRRAASRSPDPPSLARHAARTTTPTRASARAADIDGGAMTQTSEAIPGRWRFLGIGRLRGACPVAVARRLRAGHAGSVADPRPRDSGPGAARTAP